MKMISKKMLQSLLLLATVALWSGKAQAVSINDLEGLNDGYNVPEKDCIVDFGSWDVYPERVYNDEKKSNRLTLIRAVAHANEFGSILESCTDSIKIDNTVDVIKAEGPLDILRSEGDAAGEDEIVWTLNGNNKTIDFTDVDVLGQTYADDPAAWPADGKHCAFVIEGHNLLIKDLTIVNVPHNYYGLCIYGSNNKLENVEVRMAAAPGGSSSTSAIVFASGAGRNKLDENSRIAIADGTGLEFDARSVDGFSTNPVKFTTMTDNEVANAAQVQVNGQPSGVVDASGKPGFKVTGATPQNYFKNNSSVQIILQNSLVKTDPQGKRYFEFNGWVVDTSSEQDACKAPAASGKVTGVYIYGNNDAALYGIIAPKDGTKPFGLEKAQGHIKFRLPVDDLPFSDFVLIPASGNDKVGRPSAVYQIGSNVDQVECKNGAQVFGPNSGDPNAINGGVDQFGSTNIAHGFNSPQECERDRGLKPDLVPEHFDNEIATYDSDGDGVLDNDEDLPDANGVRNCVCDANETCWSDPDSDDDGLIDGIAFEKLCGVLNGAGVDCDAQRANINGLNPDSDGDNVADGAEDRNAFYQQYRNPFGSDPSSNVQHNAATARGYLYFISSVNSNNRIEYPDPADRTKSVAATCTVENTEIGVSYRTWIVFRNEVGKIVSAPQDDTPAALEAAADAVTGTPTRFLLACKSEVFRSDTTSFNGVYNAERLETNFAQFDSDLDGVKDGSDKCPGLTSAANNGCPVTGEVIPAAVQGLGGACPTSLIFFGVMYDFVEHDANDQPIGLKLGEGNPTLPDVLEPEVLLAHNLITDVNDAVQIKNVIKSIAFGDIDHDGLPDVVESPNATCQGLDPKTQLSYLDSDTDNDGLSDGPGENSSGAQSGVLQDVCPTVEGNDANLGILPIVPSQIDQYSDEVGHTYSCGNANDTLKLYQFSPTLAYFLDRDGDTLTDAQEDVKLDGVIYKPQIREVRISKQVRLDKGLESHPLLRDTDGDGLDDHFEWTTEIIQTYNAEGNSVSYFTNPGDSDSDGDQLADLAEITRDGNPEIHVDIDKRDGGCAATKEKDTDPTNPDTDFDGLLDGSEDSGILYAAPGEILSDLLKNPTFFQGNEDARRLYSSPVDKHSDGDGLTDAEEYNIVFEEGMKPQAVPALTRTMTNPCEGDTDGDSQDDNFDAEKGQCGTFGGDNAESCIPIEDEQALGGQDQDGDSLSDARERILGTDINNPDSDLDGLWDGQEDCNRNGRGIGVEMCDWTGFRETDPLLADTDGDGLNDNLEVSFGGGSSPVVVAGVSETTDPTNPDSDGDGIPDGPGGLVAGPNGEPVQSLGEDANGNGRYDTGETDPRNPDTDGDGLADGLIGGLGEDFNRNGIVDKDAKGRLLETDPRVPDTDFDGRPDGDEAMRNGRFNISRATNYNDGGCSLVTNGQGSMPAAVSFFFGLVMLATTTVRRKVKNAVSKAA